jgi:predicted metal-dependent peptidase
MAGILDRVEQKEQVPVVHVQVHVPEPLHQEVARILKARNISWQKALIAAIESIKEEAKKSE